MNKSIIITSAVIAGVGLIAASTFAASGTWSETFKGKNRWNMTQSGQVFGWHMTWNRWMNMNWPMGDKLTTEEKTAFEAMSDTEKRTFLEKKHTEMEAKRTAHETVIDKLLAGTALTASEENLRQEIITERATMKANRAEMEANRTKIQAIMTKKAAGTTLTTEEQALLDSMPKMGGRWMKGGHGGMGRNR